MEIAHDFLGNDIHVYLRIKTIYLIFSVPPEDLKLQEEADRSQRKIAEIFSKRMTETHPQLSNFVYDHMDCYWVGPKFKILG